MTFEFIPQILFAKSTFITIEWLCLYPHEYHNSTTRAAFLMVKSNIQSAENSYPIMPLAYDYHIPFISHKYSPFTLWIPLVVSSVAGKSPTHGCGRLRSPPWRLPNWPHPMAFRRKNNRWSDFMVKKNAIEYLIYVWFMADLISDL